MGQNSITSDEVTQISQRHEGSGDNVAGNKYVSQAITPEELRKPIEIILTHLRHKQIAQSKEQLLSLKQTSNLNASAIDLLETVTVLIDFAEETNIAADISQKLNTVSRQTTASFCIDIITSAQIRLDVKNSRHQDAKERFSMLERPGIYTIETFFELVADENQLEESYAANKLHMSDAEFCGLVRGYLRLNAEPKALEVAKYLSTIYPSFNSKVLVALSQQGVVQAMLNGGQYWTITATARKKLLELCDETADLINECSAKDKRVTSLAVGLFLYTHGQYKPLADACWAHISALEAHHAKPAKQIRMKYERQPNTQDEVANKIFQAQNDPSYRKSIVSKLVSEKEISSDESVLLARVADTQSIRKWVAQGGIVADDRKVTSDFCLLELTALTCAEDHSSIQSLRTQTKAFISKHKDEISSLNTLKLHDLANSLMIADLPAEAVELLKPLIPPSDIWASPLVLVYLEALFYSQQMMTLNMTMAEIDESEWTFDIWQLKAMQLADQHKYVDAIAAMENVVNKEPLYSYGWYFLLNLHKKCGSEGQLVAQVLARIPDDIFNNPTEHTYSILHEMEKVGNFERAEPYLVKWFIDDPDGNAKALTNFCFASHLGEKHDSPATLSSECDRCYGGVKYSSDGKIMMKLLVSGDVKQHQCLLDVSSPLGELLFNMSVGDIEHYGVFEIELHEKLPPYIGAIRVATELRQETNDGSDCFHSFTVPEDPDEMFKFLERKLGALQHQKEERDINSNPNIPLFMKGFQQNPADPVKAALVHLTSKETFKHSLAPYGEESPSIMLLDIYSVIYFAITGLTPYLSRSLDTIVITLETKYCLECWLKDINRSDYMTLAALPEGGILRTTADDIRERTASIQAAVEFLLENAKQVTPKLVDIPPEILVCNDAVDISVFSSMKLAITNDIPWFCLDKTFVELAKPAGYKIVNTSQLIANLKQQAPREVIHKGLALHVSAGLPYAIIYADMIELADTAEEHLLFILIEMLQTDSAGFYDLDLAISVLSQIVVNVVRNSGLDGEILKGFSEQNPRNNGYAERIFYKCCQLITMQRADKKEAEFRLALFLTIVFEASKHSVAATKLVQLLATRFINGHFMSVYAVNSHLENMTFKPAES